jgi:DNA-directed RNA polymerase specialized sigma24 family protein
MTGSDAKDFEAHRSFLAGLAYRMLGSIAEAEDVVQDAYLRWADADASTIVHPRAYLARVVTRLCLDRMKSATSRREQYVGTWLPEPIVGAPAEPMADDLSVALLVTLELNGEQVVARPPITDRSAGWLPLVVTRATRRLTQRASAADSGAGRGSGDARSLSVRPVCAGPRR